MTTRSLLAVTTALLAPAFVSAQETYPRLSGDIAIEVENDFTFESDDPAAELNDLLLATEAALALEFSEATSLNATIIMESVFDPGPSEDRVFENLGVFAEELYLRHDFGAAALSLGKFDPGFGFGWDEAPGLFGADFAEDYQLTERIGGSVEIPFQAGSTEGAFVVSAFMADRTIFSNSLIEERGNLDEADGGVSNTDAPESINAAIYAETDGVAWNLGIRRQARGVGDTDDEVGFVGGALTTLEGAEVDLLGELAYFPNFDGGPDSAFYGTVGVGVPVGSVYLSGAYSLREVQNASTDHLATVSAEYELAEGATIGLGYRFGHEGGIDSHTVGALFVYEFGF